MHKTRLFVFVPIALVLSVRFLAGKDTLDSTELPKDAVPISFVTYNFDRHKAGPVPDVWNSLVDGQDVPGLWEIKEFKDATSPPHVLTRGSSGAGGAASALLLLKDATKDYGEISIRMKTLSTDDEQTAGIIFDYVDAKNYQMIALNSRNDTCSFIRIKNGKQKLVDFKERIIAPYRWHELRLTFTRKTYTVLVDKELILGGDSKTGSKAGRVGLFVASSASVVFDDVQISK